MGQEKKWAYNIPWCQSCHSEKNENRNKEMGQE